MFIFPLRSVIFVKIWHDTRTGSAERCESVCNNALNFWIHNWFLHFFSVQPSSSAALNNDAWYTHVACVWIICVFRFYGFLFLFFWVMFFVWVHFLFLFIWCFCNCIILFLFLNFSFNLFLFFYFHELFFIRKFKVLKILIQINCIIWNFFKLFLRFCIFKLI